MLRKLFVFVVCLVATIATVSAQTPPYNEIWYTTTNGKKLDVYLSNMVSNSYNNGRGVLKFQNCVTGIGDGAFEGCSSLTSITIPNSVTSIGNQAFEGCISLTSINIPNSVTSIGYQAFEGCSSLTSITIGNSVTKIGDDAFAGCSSLKSVKVANKYCYWYFKDDISNISFFGANVSADGRCLIVDGVLEAFKAEGITEYTIPDSITKIGYRAFYNCDKLTSITIPNSVTSIGYQAFYGCSSLTSITIPKSVTSIGESAFRNCISLTSITIGNSVTEIGEYAFLFCSLKSVKVSNKYCYNYFKDEVANIAFYGANASDDGRCLIIDGELKIFIAKGITEYTIPKSVTSIGESAFRNCSSLTCITIPESVTSISEYAFYGCSSLTSITIPNSVTSIGGGAFENCSSLTSITIPDSVTEIGEWALAGCTGLTNINIPNSVTKIGERAFNGCSSLTSITCLATTPPAIDDLRIGETTMIYVPKKGVKAYKKDPDWSIYKKQIKAIK